MLAYYLVKLSPAESWKVDQVLTEPTAEVSQKNSGCEVLAGSLLVLSADSD